MILFISPKQKYATGRLVAEVEKIGAVLEAVDVRDLAERGFAAGPEDYAGLYVRQANPYYREVIELAGKFLAAGKTVIDEAFITSGYDTSKWTMYRRLSDQNIAIPQTHQLDFFGSQPLPKHPFILKWIYGFGGKHTFFVQDEQQRLDALPMHPKEEWLVQEYIAAQAEYEAYVVGGRAVGPVLKFNMQSGGFKADLARHETVPEARSADIQHLAERASLAVGAPLAKVDILEKDGRLYTLEVNRCPSFIPFEQFTGYNMPGEWIRYIHSAIESKNN